MTDCFSILKILGIHVFRYLRLVEGDLKNSHPKGLTILEKNVLKTQMSCPQKLSDDQIEPGIGLGQYKLL